MLTLIITFLLIGAVAAAVVEGLVVVTGSGSGVVSEEVLQVSSTAKPSISGNANSGTANTTKWTFWMTWALGLCCHVTIKVSVVSWWSLLHFNDDDFKGLNKIVLYSPTVIATDNKILRAEKLQDMTSDGDVHQRKSEGAQKEREAFKKKWEGGRGEGEVGSCLDCED